MFSSGVSERVRGGGVGGGAEDDAWEDQREERMRRCIGRYG